MLRTRLLTAAVLIPIVVYCIYLGGLLFLALVALLLILAEVEFCRLMIRDGFKPVLVFGIGLIWLFLLDAQLLELELLRPGLALILLGSLAWQIFHRQRYPVVDWALTVVGGLYLGVCGSYLIRLRSFQPEGLWWTLSVVLAITSADSGAYIVGRLWGRRKLAPRVSPGKSWEGYVAGVFVAGLLTALLASLSHTEAGAGSIDGVRGLLLGSLVGALAPLGDLAISMIKRQVGVKDSGKIIPGHGGALDRLDSILWAAVIGYYYVVWFAT